MPPSTRRFAEFLVALALTALAGCAATLVTNRPDATIVDVASRRVIGEAALVDALAHVRFRLLGELHDDPEHHAIRARLVGEIARRGVHPAVVFEQFDLEHDAALVAAQIPGATPETLATAGRLDRKGWAWPMHAPIIAAALAAHLPIRAGNLSRSAITALTGGRDDAVARATERRWLPRLRAAPWSAAQGRTLNAEIVESHCNMLPADVVPRLVEGERMRDAAMAQALVDAATDDGAILIAGDGHVRANLGVPVYLHAPGLPGATATSISVGFVESDAPPGTPVALDAHLVVQLVAEHPGFDYLWVTPRIARADPCAEFPHQSKPSPRAAG
ncbi:MAG TPA: ChaN family lipoprotein [Casimicrobiaceae bacterium]|nr:ChaN family lipoprotein [Casimicrobiaceae bacterium]